MTITRTVEVSLTPEELGQQFAEMFDTEQAAFFTAVAEVAKSWPSGGFCVQACSISQRLTPEGRDIIRKLAEHAGLIEP